MLVGRGSEIQLRETAAGSAMLRAAVDKDAKLCFVEEDCRWSAMLSRRVDKDAKLCFVEEDCRWSAMLSRRGRKEHEAMLRLR